MSISEVVDRVSYILDAYEDDCIIAINDPNLLSDCYRISLLEKTNLMQALSSDFQIKLFCIHRDYSSFIASWAKMQFSLLGNKVAGQIATIQYPIDVLMAAPNWLKSFEIQQFPVYDMEFVTSRTSAFVKDLFASYGLGDLRGITMPSPENPNPAKKIDYSSITNPLKVLEQRWKHFDNPAGIHQKIKISSTEYANALRQMHQTWQQ